MKNTLLSLRTALPLAIAASALLAGCGETREEKAAEAEKAAVTPAANIELPPAIKKSETLRCKDGSLVYVDFMADDKSAGIATEKGGTITRVTADDTTKPMVSADGTTKITGHAAPVEVTLPGKGTQTCKG